MKPWRLAVGAGVLLWVFVSPVGAQEEEGTPDSDAEGYHFDFSGYLKPIMVHETKDFGDLGPSPRESFEALGGRAKIRLEGSMGPTTRVYANYILDYSKVDRANRRLKDEDTLDDSRILEMYLDLMTESTLLRIGALAKNWYEFNGVYDPSDRFNPRDNGFLGYALEDSKIPETGVSWSWFFAADHALTLTFIPIGEVEGFSPTLSGFYDYLGYTETTAPEQAGSSNSKFALEFGGKAGDLTYLFTYINGLNPKPDFANEGYALDADGDSVAQNGKLDYNRYQSPALDLTYVFTEETIGKFDIVYYETPDTTGGGDPLKQNDWYEWLTGAEMHFGGTQFDLHYGQKIIPGARETDDLDLDVAKEKREYFEYALLGQPRETTHIVSSKLQTRFGAADWLGFKFDLLLNADKDGKLMRTRFRSELAFYLAPEDALLIRIRPEYDNNREITTKRLWAEVEQKF